MSQFPLIPSRTALLFFDALNTYFHPNGPHTRNAAAAAEVVRQMVRVNHAARAAGVAVMYAMADHRPDGKDFVPRIADRWYFGQPGEPPRLSTPPQVTTDPWRREIVAEIAPQEGDYLIRKHRWSAFYQTPLELSLRSAGIDTLLLAGGATEIGVASTAYAARDHDLNLIVLRDACLESRAGGNAFFMDHVFPIFSRVMSVDQIVEDLDVERSSVVRAHRV